MKKLLYIIAFLLVCSITYAQPSISSRSAFAVRTRTANFGNILSTADTQVQKALDTIDDTITSSTPLSAGSTCTAGTLAYASGFLYICVSSNTWQRVAIATWAVTDRMKLSTGDLLLLSTGDKLLIRQ